MILNPNGYVLFLLNSSLYTDNAHPTPHGSVKNAQFVSLCPSPFITKAMVEWAHYLMSSHKGERVVFCMRVCYKPLFTMLLGNHSLCFLLCASQGFLLSLSFVSDYSFIYSTKSPIFIESLSLSLSPKSK